MEVSVHCAANCHQKHNPNEYEPATWASLSQTGSGGGSYLWFSHAALRPGRAATKTERDAPPPCCLYVQALARRTAGKTKGWKRTGAEISGAVWKGGCVNRKDGHPSVAGTMIMNSARNTAHKKLTLIVHRLASRWRVLNEFLPCCPNGPCIAGRRPPFLHGQIPPTP